MEGRNHIILDKFVLIRDQIIIHVCAKLITLAFIVWNEDINF